VTEDDRSCFQTLKEKSSAVNFKIDVDISYRENSPGIAPYTIHQV
jgi:hypothetical protein